MLDEETGNCQSCPAGPPDADVPRSIAFFMTGVGYDGNKPKIDTAKFAEIVIK